MRKPEISLKLCRSFQNIKEKKNIKGNHIQTPICDHNIQQYILCCVKTRNAAVKKMLLLELHNYRKCCQ